MEELHFEPFQKTGGRFKNYTISITRAAALGFGSGFYFRNNLKNYTYVNLSYAEKPRKAIGFQFNKDPKLPGNFKITHHRGQNSGAVAILSFIRAYTIDVEKYAGRYQPHEYNDRRLGKLFYIDLDSS